MSSRVNVGISGLGRSGWDIHANALEKCSHMYNVVAVFDPLEERRREAVDRFSCKAYTDFSSFVKDEDVELPISAAVLLLCKGVAYLK